MSLVNIIIPFIILISVVVFVHEYGHYYYAKKYGVKVQIFQSVLAKNYLAGQIKMGHVGKFALYLWEVM